MLQASNDDRIFGRRYALCVGISTYTDPSIRNVRYAVNDATIIAERLADPQRGNFAATVLAEPVRTTKEALDEAVAHLLSAPDRQAEDLTLLYFSCHGRIDEENNTFCLLPSNARQRANGSFEQATVIGLSDLAKWFSQAKTHNIVLILDVCHSGGAGLALQQFDPHLEVGPNYFIFGAARQDRIAEQSSWLKHGVFTYCFLRAIEQPPTKDGWLTISQIQNFISEEITWFAKDRPVEMQSSSMSVNPLLPLVRNPGYPELCPLPPFWNVPVPRNIFFTGQEVLLSQLANMLQNEQKTALMQPHALSGLGGIGKTQLALEYAYRHRQDYHAILWGRADTHEALISTFVSIAYLLDLPQKDEADQKTIVEAVKTWLRNRSQWLFILDNADDLTLVQEFLPFAFRGHLLLTTRAQAMGKVVGSKLEVEVMQPEIGALLLLRRARILTGEASLEEASKEEATRAKELAEELGGLPLALDQAGAYIEETQCGLVGYQKLYQVRRAELLAQRGGMIDDHPEAVATTWSLSFEKVSQANPVATELLNLCAFLAPDAIPEILLTSITTDIHQFNQAIAALRAYSLINRDDHTQALIIHRLVQAVLRDSMSSEIQQKWMQYATHTITAAFPDLDFANWSIIERLLPHALVCVTWIQQALLVTSDVAYLLNEVGCYLQGRVRYVEAEPLLLQALAIREQQLDVTNPQIAQSLNNLAALYQAQSKYREAEPLLKRALAISEQQFGETHLQTAHSLNNLAALYQAQDKHEEAEPLLLRALTIYEQQFGAEHPKTAHSLNNLALLYQAQDKYKEAEPLLLQALYIREHHLDATHPETVQSLNNLALLYQAQDKYKEAEPLSLQALAICEQWGETRPEVADSLNILATLYYHQSKYEEMEPLLQRALQIREHLLGDTHHETATCLHNLAALYYTQSKYEQADSLLKRALHIREQRLGITHRDTIDSLNDLVEVCRKLGKQKEAEPLLKQALATCMRRLGINHFRTQQIIKNYLMLFSEIHTGGDLNVLLQLLASEKRDNHSDDGSAEEAPP